ncbi:MAG: hypothetical protein WC222_04540 [Parachlamydiales bacterium]
MWHREYKDYPTDLPLKHERLEPGKGIIGCEMHDINGWGNTVHVYRPKKKGFFRRWIEYFMGIKKAKPHG